MRTQFIFLVDTNLENSTDSPTTFANSVCLSCLRLLSYLTAWFEKCLMGKKSKQSHNLKWSYKFFNSKVHHTRIESHKIYDFKLRYFEEFENELRRRLEIGSNRLSNAKAPLKIVRAADNIAKAFTEILADFKWENQELWSPVKGKKFRKDQPDQTNLVFLFTKCPKTFQELKEFTGKRIPDEEIFLSSLFPNTLLQQFCRAAKLTVHWIDTQHFTNLNDSEPSAHEIVRKAVESTGGSVISLHCFARQGCPYFTDIQYLLQESAEHGKPQTTCHTTQLLPLATVIRSLSVPLNSRVTERGSVVSTESARVAIQIGNKTLEVSLTPQNVETRTQKKPSRVGRCWLPHQSCLHGYAVLQKTCLVRNIPVQGSFLCRPSVRKDTGKNISTFTDGCFEMLLSRLAVKRSILVLVCVKYGQLFILEPLTTHTATLGVLSSDTSLSMEKMLLRQKTNKVTVPDMDEKFTLCDGIVHRRVDSLHLTKEHEVEETTGVSRFDGQQMGSWVIPGCTKTVQKLVTKLNDRISELDYLSTDEIETLKQLKKVYRAEKQPPGLRDTTTCNTSSAGPETRTGSLEKNETQQKARTSQASLSRADKILCKSKEMVDVSNIQKKETVCNAGNKLETDKPKMPSHLSDFENVDELKSYLTSMYERLVSGELTDIDSCIQSMITVALHYFQLKEDKSCAKGNCKKLMEETILSSGSELREKYSQTQELPLEQRISEYETQILLRMEIISSLEEKEKTEGEETTDEIVGMLRTLSFISEPGLLSKFMQSSFLHNYMHSIPQTLADIYDELMQPLPESLASILSPDDNSANQSDLKIDSVENETIGGPPSARTRSHASVEPQSSQASKMDLAMSRGSRKLVHHYSMDFGPKRQIVVDKVPKKENQRSAKKKTRHSGSKRISDKAHKSPHQKKRGGVKLQRHQSVAVMQRSHKTPKKNEVPKSKRNAVTPRRQLGKLVAETPCHKQATSVLNKTLPHLIPMDVVSESPEKICDLSHGHSPAKGKRAKALLRRSFYSAPPVKRSKNLSQYFQLANRIAGRQPQPATNLKKQSKLLSAEPPCQFLSPDKNSSFLLSQLEASPSPARPIDRRNTKTPSKVLDSPCRNTRSKVCESPTVDFLRFPGSGVGQPSPVSRSRQRSCSKRQSPRVLAARSGIKEGPGMSQTTPEKSQAIGVVTFGLDSPSQNTRQRLAQTPTRKSVRAVLFAKSPVTKNHSSYRAVASPRTLLDKFESPVKSSARSAVNNTLPEALSFSKMKNVVGQSDDEKPLHLSKTPSPNTKKVTKTPDSFDKWRRVKTCTQQKSPCVRTLSTVVATKPLAECQKTEMNRMNRSVMDEMNPNQHEEYKEKDVKGSFRKKRCLLQSPEKSVGSFSKRQRTVSFGSQEFCSQGFDVTGSLSEMSQVSGASPMDYLSSTNDDVFLSSQNSGTFESMYGTGNKDVRIKKRLLLSDEQGNGRSQSPVFGCSSKKTSNSKQVPVNNYEEFSQKNNVYGNNSEHFSPVRIVKSPATKKYSPNVSAKSLMHLIQSPLLRSPDNSVGKNSSKTLSPRSAVLSPNSKIVERHSRRSLKLNN